MGISFDIKKESRLRQEIMKYAGLINNLKIERESLLNSYSRALFYEDEAKTKAVLLKIAANQSLMDAYNLCLKAIKMEIGV